MWKITLAVPLESERANRACPPSVGMIQYRPLDELGSGAMAAHHALDVVIEVQILAPQQKRLPIRESFHSTDLQA